MKRNWISWIQLRHLLALLAAVLLPSGQVRFKEAFASLIELLECGDDLGFIRCALTYLYATSGDIDRRTMREHISHLKHPILKEETMNILEQWKAEGQMEGLSKGQVIGAIQELQKLLGQPVDSKELLSEKSDNELSVQRDLLEKAVIERMRSE